MGGDAATLVVGLGKMGGAIAGRLASVGREVLGFDLSPAARDRAARTGVTPVSDLSEGIARARTVLTSLPDPKAVFTAYSGRGGIVELLRPNSVVIELSTIDPFTMQEIAGELVDRVVGVKVVDSPVSGGVEEASSGTLSLMVGGAPDDIDAARSVLDDLGRVLLCGGLGDGKVIKLVNNLVAISNVLGAAEALALASAAGVDPHNLHTVLSQSGASSYQLNKRMPRMIDHDLEPRFSLALAAKDLRLARDLADRLGVDLAAGDTVLARFVDAEGRGLGELDMAAVWQLYAKQKD